MHIKTNSATTRAKRSQTREVISFDHNVRIARKELGDKTNSATTRAKKSQTREVTSFD